MESLYLNNGSRLLYLSGTYLVKDMLLIVIDTQILSTKFSSYFTAVDLESIYNGIQSRVLIKPFCFISSIFLKIEEVVLLYYIASSILQK